MSPEQPTKQLSTREYLEQMVKTSKDLYEHHTKCAFSAKAEHAAFSEALAHVIKVEQEPQPTEASNV